MNRELFYVGDDGVPKRYLEVPSKEKLRLDFPSEVWVVRLVVSVRSRIPNHGRGGRAKVTRKPRTEARMVNLR